MSDPHPPRRFDGRTFLWDGRDHVDEAAVRAAADEYERKGFEVKKVSDEGRTLLYTRRTVSAAPGS